MYKDQNAPFYLRFLRLPLQDGHNNDPCPVEMNSMEQIEQLVEISRRYGADNSYVIAGGGNTSFKTADKLWVKASGHALATITVEGFAVMDRALLGVVATKTYSLDPATREEQVKADLAAANLTPGRRPSVETSMHDAISAPFVVHLHPTLVVALVSSNRAAEASREIFGESALYLPYVDPGYLLFKEVRRGIAAHKEAHGAEPRIILLQNHGIFVSGDTPGEIVATYDELLGAIEARLVEPLPSGEALAEYYDPSGDHHRDVSRPFTPDQIVYRGSTHWPEVYADMMKIAWLTRSFGGPHPMTDEQIDFIDNWEVENYRRSVARTK
jgi:ribulose-5-phosphate 4-epimerase/fuculose-1-phosphate aldolase